MAVRWYLMALDVVGNARGPKYLKWRHNAAALDVQWSLMDFGALAAAVVAADTNSQQHLELIAYDDCAALDGADADDLALALAAVGIDGAGLRGARPGELLHRVLATAQAYQAAQAIEAAPGAMARMAAPVDVGAIVQTWRGVPIHFGIAGKVTDGAARD